MIKRFPIMPIYRLYQKRLLRKVQAQPMPKHIGLILDGNRRYGRLKQLTEPQAIYTNGADRLDDLLDWCVDLGIPAITLWVFSTENLDRAPEEVSGLLAAIEAKLRRLTANPLIHRQRVRVRAVGRLELLPISTQAAVRAAEIATADYDGLQLTLAAAYGGRQEITDAMRALLREPQYCNQTAGDVAAQITPAVLGRYMYVYFTDVFWPAFRRIDFLRAVRAYQQRQRRFGQ